MLQPVRTKFRKAFKGRIHGTATSGTTLAFGQYGLKALEPERVTARQIEAARRALTRFMKRSGRVWIRVFPEEIDLLDGAADRRKAAAPRQPGLRGVDAGFRHAQRRSRRIQMRPPAG